MEARLTEPETIIQLPLPLRWYDNPEIWRDGHIECVHRPTERDALRNLFRRGRALMARPYMDMTALERDVARLESECLRDNPHIQQPPDVAAWITQRLRVQRVVMFPGQVLSMLDGISIKTAYLEFAA